MLCFKFVTKNLESPGTFGKLYYGNFGVPIEVTNCADKTYGQCASGIHVIPVTENPDFLNCIFSDKIIYGSVNEEDIIWSDQNGKMRVKKFMPLGLLTPKVRRMWSILIKSPEFAYYYALRVDKRGKRYTRKAASFSPARACDYAQYVDKKPTRTTRRAVLCSADQAYLYAYYVDKRARNDTRKAVLCSPKYAYKYAVRIDECAREDTRKAVEGSEYANSYNLGFGRLERK